MTTEEMAIIKYLRKKYDLPTSYVSDEQIIESTFFHNLRIIVGFRNMRRECNKLVNWVSRVIKRRK